MPSTAGGPPAFDPEDYKGRNVAERPFNRSRDGADWPPATTNTITYRGGLVLGSILFWLQQLQRHT